MLSIAFKSPGNFIYGSLIIITWGEKGRGR